LVIENEGPRVKFREKLARKLATWEGAPWAPNVDVLDFPWGRFSLKREEHRRELAEVIAARDADLVVAGPVKRLGMIGGGTPDEVSAFSALLMEVRSLLDHPISFFLVHHENKAGEVSGAWEGETDTLIHIKKQGKERSLLHFQKARWAPETHDSKLELRWVLACEGFEIIEAKEEDRHADLLTALADEEWRSVSYLRQTKTKGGVGTHPDTFIPVLEGAPEIFEEASGKQLAKAGGRYFRLRRESSRGPRDGWDDSSACGEDGRESSRRPAVERDGRRDGSTSPAPEPAGSGRDVSPDSLITATANDPDPEEVERLAEVARRTLAAATDAPINFDGQEEA
jgi:hypothetical protein